MNEREFLSSKQSSWKSLEAILQKSAAGGLKSLSSEEISELGPLYRRASSDLAYARAHAVSAALVSHLNALVARAYALLYQTDTRNWKGPGYFLRQDFPQTFRRRYPFFLAAVCFMLLGTLTGYLLVVHSRDNIDLFIPPKSPLHDSIRYWESGKVYHKTADGQSAIYASALMTNNIQVSFVAYAFGILAGLPSAYSLFYNGAVLGGMAGLMTQFHQYGNFWPGILPHGIVELSETCLAGAAGLSLGWALLVPGPWRRKDALAMAALDSVKLVLGGIVLLVFAGLTEGFISHSLLPKSLKIVYGVLSGICLYMYLFRAGRNTPDEGI
jgi:uncharacterized membrane protein SpoIIM required for sporulation